MMKTNCGKQRYWCSWVQMSDDYRPLTDPPADGVLGWWCSGYDSDDNSILCAIVEADKDADPAAIVRVSWPEMTEWRFCDVKEPDWLPNDRFPLKDWMRARIGICARTKRTIIATFVLPVRFGN